jgi:hypothetical protein
MAICCVFLILALLDEQIDSRERSVKASAFKSLRERSGFYLTGQVAAAYSQVRLTPQDFGSPRRLDFAKLNLHLPACRSLGAGRTLFEQPGKDDLFSSLLIFDLSSFIFDRCLLTLSPNSI